MYLQYITKIYALALGLIFFSQWGYGQLGSYVQTAQSHNKTLKVSSLSTEIAHQGVAIMKARKYPKITFDNQYFLANGGRKIAFNSGDLMNPVYNSLFQLTGNQSLNTTIPNYSEQFYPDQFYRTNLSLTWPIWNRKIRFAYKSAGLQYQINSYKEGIVNKEIEKEVKLAYFELYRLHKLITFQKQLMKYLDKVKMKTKKLIDFGYAETIDLDQIEYELAKQNQEELQLSNVFKVVEDKFYNLLGEDKREAIIFDESDFVLAQYEINTSEDLSGIYDAKDQAQIIEIQGKINQLEMKRWNNWIPDVSVVFRSGFEGFSESIALNDDYFVLGTASLSWTLFEGGVARKKKDQLSIKSVLLAKQKQDSQLKFEVLVKKNQHELNTQKHLLAVLEKKKNLSKKIMEHQKKKFLMGELDIIDLLNFKTKYEQDVTKYYNTKVAYIQNSINYQWLVNP